MDTQTLALALAQATVERMQIQEALAQSQERIKTLEAQLAEVAGGDSK